MHVAPAGQGGMTAWTPPAPDFINIRESALGRQYELEEYRRLYWDATCKHQQARRSKAQAHCYHSAHHMPEQASDGIRPPSDGIVARFAGLRVRHRYRHTSDKGA